MLRIATVAAILIFTANAAFADSQASLNVPFGDLNLSQAKDARILADRLQTAAEQVCLKANPDLTDRRIGQLALQQCVQSAINIAMDQIESNPGRKVRANLISARQLQASR